MVFFRHLADTRKTLCSRKIISQLFRMEYPPMCMLSVLVPAHFWPSLKHLSSRCCFWQALHDIKSEILTENQTASRPLAAPIYRLLSAPREKNLYVLCLPVPDLQLAPTWNKLLYHNPLCFLPPFFCPLDPEVTAAVSKLQTARVSVSQSVSICFKSDVSCPSRRRVAWVDSALNGFYWQGLMW